MSAENELRAPSDADLARLTAHTAEDWAQARARLGDEFDAVYEHVARLAVCSQLNKVARAADDVGAALGIPRPEGWTP